MDSLSALHSPRSRSSTRSPRRRAATLIQPSSNPHPTRSPRRRLGAVDYLIKPVCVNAIKMLVRHLRTNYAGEGWASPADPSVPATSLSKFEVIRKLGLGSRAAVSLVRRRADGNMYAMKKIPLTNLEDERRTCAMQEAMLLRVLVHPKIIRHFDEQVRESR